jgi:hypothetical protein
VIHEITKQRLPHIDGEALFGFLAGVAATDNSTDLT